LPLRRLTVVQLLPALDSGGVERSTLEHAAALAKAGHRSVVVSSGGRLLPLLRRDGSEHVELAIGRKALSSLRFSLMLRRLFRELQPDIVLARSRFPAWLGWLALRGWLGRRPRFLTAVHGLNSPGRYSSILARGECVACVSATVRDHVLKQWPATDPRRLRVLPHGIDPEEFPPALASDPEWRAKLSNEHPALAGGRLLLLPGRASRSKGHDHALALLAGLRAQGCDARLWLPGAMQRGREVYAGELQARAMALGVADAVAITPARDDIAQAYAASDLVLQLSDEPEAFGRTVLEALAMRRPVLGWAHGGVGELLQRHFPAGAARPFDHGLLLARAQGLLADPPPVTAAIPTLESAQARWLELYDQLLA
jgi:glycosyltransferase involved in cell wall biosynthesis